MIKNYLIEKELAMSDKDFEKNYLENNKKWWGIYAESHKRTLKNSKN